MSITLLDIWRAARVRSVPFSGESAGYLALALCEETRSVPRSLELTDVELLADGSVRVISAAACPEAQGEKQLRALLSRLLEVASSPGPSLWRAAGRVPAGGVSGLAAELQKALIPFNRAAARRALLRLFRETERAVTEGRLGELPDSGSEEGLLRLSPPPTKVSEVVPAAAPPVSASPERVETPPVRVAPAQVAPAQVAPPQLLLAPEPDEPEQLTRPETVVSRRLAKAKSWPPPLPATEHGVVPRTPRMGSMDVSVFAVPSAPPFAVRSRTPSPPPLPVNDDLTERVPEVAEFLADDEGESPAPVTSVHVADSEEVAEPLSVEVEPPALVIDAGQSPALVTGVHVADSAEVAEPVSDEDESPALVIGVHVADSEAVAEPVSDEDLETRPLPVLAPPMPYAGVSVQPTDVRELLRGFQVAEGVGEAELRRELKALAGVDLTPGSAVEVVPR